MALDKKLSRLRKKEGLSQAEVAEKLDVSRQAVSRWESGEAKPSTDNFQALCKLYHVSIDDLLNESEEELPAPATESRPKGDTQRKEKRWIRWLAIGVAFLVLLVCALFGMEVGRRKMAWICIRFKEKIARFRKSRIFI